MDAYKVQIEWDENGCYLHLTIDPDAQWDYRDGDRIAVRLNDPEQAYDAVRASIGPWLRERDAARYRAVAFRCDPDESTGWSERAGYDTSDPKHPDFHSVHADLWDMREGK